MKIEIGCKGWRGLEMGGRMIWCTGRRPEAI